MSSFPRSHASSLASAFASATRRVFAALALLGLMLALLIVASPRTLLATDIDGAGDCARPSTMDFGDAPEGVFAYPGIPGRFPTCLAAGPVGTQDVTCVPISTVPGPTGFVRHVNPPAGTHYWLNCSPGADFGIDSESDAKMNANGAMASTCNAAIAVDCVEAAFGMMFGQDECLGSTDAGIDPPPMLFVACSTGVVTYRTLNCLNAPRTVYLNILLDMNQDGDWNDNFLCGTACAYEWTVKNTAVVLPPGCAIQTSPTFFVGPNAGNAWLRISLSDAPVSDDFPWRGSAGVAGQTLLGGETEDYPVAIREAGGDDCARYEDFGDAPEGTAAYPSGVLGSFPTCIAPSPAGTRTTVCAPISTVPGMTGHVRHVSPANEPIKIWLGCGAPLPGSVDSEVDGKMNGTGLGASTCDPAVTVDCAEPAFSTTMVFGQDECWGDVDAGVIGPVTFSTCELETIKVDAFNCRQFGVQAFLNILVDWNEDGDWNDNLNCDAECVYEWSVQNLNVFLVPGCNTFTPVVLAGPKAGNGWMRVTITPFPVPADFPWAGSAGMAGGSFIAGETEDYPVIIEDARTGVSSESPSGFSLAPLSPNPTTAATLVRFQLPHASDVKIVAYDVSGRAVRTLVDARMPAGSQQQSWDFRDDKGRELPAGVYLVQMRAGAESVTRRVIRLN
ncbi:MAG: FlgD immunoglobulin-like domain containing protein [bacterium]